MAELENAESTGKKKKSGAMPLVIALVVLTAIGGGGGWVIGGMLAGKLQPAAEEKAAEAKKEKEGEKKKEGEGLPHISNETTGVVALEPITTNLAYPSESWIRLEVALMFKDKPDVKVSEEVHQDILFYLRTVSLQQIEGPRGFQYLRDDIQERVDQRSQGRVTKVMFRTFVIE
ncbi:flagellar basal body protein FliL [Metarhizobium album]|uniref:Flagellar protein FliL n=1 Tax=Metarhizobium album TaxID=2182425 RepID=A0A2U2DWV5_9HYPH|nr:flagellar basal body-associated FliL family protein [Rhizobium album]PWE57805.1 flagellar basal body protein FliL [Rhizobium album]